MSSPTSDSYLNPITNYISLIQRKEIFTKQRIHSIRQYFLQSVGLTILLYFILQIPILLYFLFKLLLRLIFQIFSLIFWLPLKTIELILPKTNNYGILFPLLFLFSTVSYLIAKLTHKNVETNFGKRYKVLKNNSFILIFIVFLLLQSIFILFPIAGSIQKQKQLPLNSLISKQTKIDSLEKSNILIKNNENIKRQELNRLKANDTIQNKKSSYLENNFESDVEDEHSNLVDRDRRHMVDVENLNTNFPFKISSDEERELLFKQQANKLVDSNQQFSSNVLENSTKQSVGTFQTIMKKKTSSIRSELEEQQSLIYDQKLNNWLDGLWNINYPTKFDFQELHSLSLKYLQHLPQYDVSSIYTAYTDLNCYDYTSIIDHYQSTKQKYIHFLDTYRRQTPFPVYLSILQSNGPKCYRYYPNLLCANSQTESNRFSKVFIINTILIITLVIILVYRQYNKKSNKTQEIILNKPNDISLQQTTPTITENYYYINPKIKNQLSSWLEYEQNDNYENIRDKCRLALNNKLLKKYEQLQIEKLQFTDAKIYHISQKSNEPPVINATLNIDNLVFNILNPIKKHYYSIEIPKLTGELQIYLINNIEVKFKQIQINSVDIIDSKNILSSDEKQSIIKLLTEIISQTIVQFSFHLPDKQDKIVNEPVAVSAENEFHTPPPTPLTPLESCEIPILTPAKINNQQICPPQEPKKLLVRIVKAVKLHDVEQPFCLLQLNHPKQTHQTSIAKNGLNPFWDERFIFDCNDKSNEIHLKIFDRKKPNKKLPSNTNDILYADVSIPFSYVTSTIYKQDVRMTPQYPESMIRIEVKISKLHFLK
ncbi:unnamed protein product [Adineta steineri]|uniref:C2 domain-containing protein n=1 Tax=Adineta steineri TaxID=433720 RepID=A0A814TCY4_9BILA|nr:unnamed protein product [Adineta steineri]